MLVQFSVGNYLSFKEEVTFSMVGDNPIKEHEGVANNYNITKAPSTKIKLLKSAVLYGANGSGKSNLLQAMDFFKEFILTSSNARQATDKIEVIPFLLSTETEDAASFFEMIFFVGDIRYRYGFEVTEKEVETEWLFAMNSTPSAKEKKLFTREFQEITCNARSFKEGKGLEKNTRPNALFLSLVAQLNGEIANAILGWLSEQFVYLSGLEQGSKDTVTKFKEEEIFRTQVIAFFKSVDIGFYDIEIVEKITDQNPSSILFRFQQLVNKLKPNIKTTHQKFDKKGQQIGYQELDFKLQSAGTKKIFNLLAPIFEAIQEGKILIIDELDARIHTLLTIELIKFFHSKANIQAQLIFASHDTNLLKKELFRRDQIWFTEKSNQGSTDLYSLVEYKVNQAKVRNDASFEKDYLLGKYGAIPFLGDLEQFKQDFL